MSVSPLLQRPRNRFVAFSAVGAAMVCLPLWQLMQHQQSALQQLAAQRALLDPVSQAVHVQFGLLSHRQLSGQLLQGQAQLEPARMAVQVGVDEQLQALQQVLTQGLWHSALAEARDLTRDWVELARSVQRRTLTAAQSEQAHSLRVEQTLQVLDLLTAAEVVSAHPAHRASKLASSPATGSGVRLAEAARLLGQLAAELPTQLDVEGSPPQPHDPDWERLQGRLLQRLTALHNALGAAGRTAVVAAAPPASWGAPAAETTRAAPSPAGTGSVPPAAAVPATSSEPKALERALAAATLSSLQVLQVPALSGANPAERRSRFEQAVQQAHQAQWALFKEALGQQQRLLAQQEREWQLERVALLAALAMLGSAALALAAGLLRHLHSASDGDVPPPMGAEDPQLHETAAHRTGTLATGRRWAAGSAADTLFGPAPGPVRGPSPPVAAAGLLMDRLRAETSARTSAGPRGEQAPADTPSASADTKDLAGAGAQPEPPKSTPTPPGRPADHPTDPA
jgi:hypothetical protein